MKNSACHSFENSWNAAVAQSVARVLGKDEVGGSIPPAAPHIYGKRPSHEGRFCFFASYAQFILLIPNDLQAAEATTARNRQLLLRSMIQNPLGNFRNFLRADRHELCLGIGPSLFREKKLGGGIDRVVLSYIQMKCPPATTGNMSPNHLAQCASSSIPAAGVNCTWHPITRRSVPLKS